MTHVNDVPFITLNDGNRIPQLGLGVYQIEESEVERVVRDALDIGYRHIDTATVYRNEAGVGEAIARSGVSREDIFLTTKLWNEDQGRQSALRAFERSLDLLQTDYVDLYLVHWPAPARGLYEESWQALEEIAASGRARSIGVSNFLVPHLRSLFSTSSVVPAVNQIELHPRFQQDEVVRFGAEHGIVTEAYSPLAQGAAHDLPVILDIAAAHERTPAQVVLRWHLQRGTIVIPKSVRRERLAENIAVFDFVLSDAEMESISALDDGGRINNDPAVFG